MGRTFLFVLATFDVLLSTRGHSSLERNTVLLRPVHIEHKYVSLVHLLVQRLPKCLNSESQVEDQTLPWVIML